MSTNLRMWKEHGNALFTHNLRLYYLNSEVNDALKNTLSTLPENFWYFNNGITVICDSISKSAVGSPARVVGVFNCDGASIVNGAQTVGTIGESWRSEQSEEPTKEAWVQVRIISLERCPPDLSRAITRAANLQNAVGNREFAAMDPVQHRLATEFALDKRKYAYSREKQILKAKKAALLSRLHRHWLAINPFALAVQAKRELALCGRIQTDNHILIYSTSTPQAHAFGARYKSCVPLMENFRSYGAPTLLGPTS